MTSYARRSRSHSAGASRPRATAWWTGCGRTPSTGARGRPGWPRASTQRYAMPSRARLASARRRPSPSYSARTPTWRQTRATSVWDQERDDVGRSDRPHTGRVEGRQDRQRPPFLQSPFPPWSFPSASRRTHPPRIVALRSIGKHDLCTMGRSVPGLSWHFPVGARFHRRASHPVAGTEPCVYPWIWDVASSVALSRSIRSASLDQVVP